MTMVRVEDGGRLGNDKMGCNKQVWDKTDIVLSRDDDEHGTTLQD